MTRREIIAAWNAQAGDANSWIYLGEDEKLEWAIKLERKRIAALVLARTRVAIRVLDGAPAASLATSLMGEHLAAEILAGGGIDVEQVISERLR